MAHASGFATTAGERGLARNHRLACACWWFAPGRKTGDRANSQGWDFARSLAKPGISVSRSSAAAGAVWFTHTRKQSRFSRSARVEPAEVRSSSPVCAREEPKAKTADPDHPVRLDTAWLTPAQWACSVPAVDGREASGQPASAAFWATCSKPGRCSANRFRAAGLRRLPEWIDVAISRVAKGMARRQNRMRLHRYGDCGDQGLDQVIRVRQGGPVQRSATSASFTGGHGRFP